jgi:hypothetical protein
MSTSSGFDEQSVLALVNQVHAADPAKSTFTLTEIAEALYGPGSAAIARAVDSSGQPISRPDACLDGRPQQHLEETWAGRPAHDHDNRACGFQLRSSKQVIVGCAHYCCPWLPSGSASWSSASVTAVVLADVR